LHQGVVITSDLEPSMSTPEHARKRGLRAALAAAGGRAREAAPPIVITSLTLLAALAASGCLPKWGPPAPPAFPEAGRTT